MIKIIDDLFEENVKRFTDVDDLQEYVNDCFGSEGSAIKLVLILEDDSTEVFYLVPVNDEATIIIHGDSFEYEADPDNWGELVFDYVDREVVKKYVIFNNYSFQIIIEKQ